MMMMTTLMMMVMLAHDDDDDDDDGDDDGDDGGDDDGDDVHKSKCIWMLECVNAHFRIVCAFIDITECNCLAVDGNRGHFLRPF